MALVGQAQRGKEMQEAMGKTHRTLAVVVVVAHPKLEPMAQEPQAAKVAMEPQAQFQALLSPMQAAVAGRLAYLNLTPLVALVALVVEVLGKIQPQEQTAQQTLAAAAALEDGGRTLEGLAALASSSSATQRAFSPQPAEQ